MSAVTAVGRDPGAFQREGVAAGRLLVQRCRGCAALLQPPRPMCPHCHGLDMGHVEAARTGSVYAWVAPRHGVPEGARPVIALVELDEGVRVLAGLEGVEAAAVRNGLRVEARFGDDDGEPYLHFVPSADQEANPPQPPATPPSRAPAARRTTDWPQWDRTAIAGIGQTEFSKDSGRSELSLAAEACLAAVRDAGMEPADIDGLVTYTQDTSTEIALMDTLGIPELTFQARGVGGGHAANPVVQVAASAVIAGAARAVLVWRAFNERSQYRFGQPPRPPRPARRAERFLNTPPAQYGLSYQRYLHAYGVTSEDLGRYSVVARKHAATNPNAWFYERPITLEDHQASRWIVEPVLRLLDCCQESDGGVAIVVTSAERAADGPQRAATITAAAQGYARGHGGGMLGFFEGDLSGLRDCEVVARQLFGPSGLTIADMDAAMLYENFSPLVFLQLEALGACGRGEAKDFVAAGEIEVGGALPVNTHGGLLGEAYIHGLNNVVEAVRQVRGTSPNQVPGARHVVVANGVGGLVLSSPDA